MEWAGKHRGGATQKRLSFLIALRIGAEILLSQRG